MKLIRLQLENYQGIREFGFTANGNDVEIHGDNATGKTTVANAITWLLYDKASTGAKNYSPKTVDADGNDVHYLDHSVEGVFKHGGSSVTLKKVMREDWKKKRGSNVEEFAGHLIEYYIDGVPVKQKEYRARLDGICDPEKAKILTIPEHFAQELHWKDRRNVLMELCADLTDRQVIDAHAELIGLEVFLVKPNSDGQFYTVEEYVAIANAKKSEINKELTLIPARIDEANRAMPDVDGLDLAKIEIKLEEAMRKRGEIEGKISACKQSGSHELRAELADANAEMSEARAKFLQEQSERNAAIDAEIRRLEKWQHEIDREIRQATDGLVAHRRDVERMVALREKCLADYNTEKAKAFEYDDTCPTCGQAIPEDQINAAREQFNLNKSKKLTEINERGKAECSREMIAALQAKCDGEEMKIAELRKKFADTNASIHHMEKQSDRSRFEHTPEWAAVQAKIERVRALISGEANTSVEEISRLREALRGVQGDIDTLEGDKLNIRYAKAQKERIEQLMDQEKELAAEYEHVQQGVYLAERFITLKAEMLTESINSKFSAVRFKLYDKQINGGIADTCEVMVPCAQGLVPFSKANNAGRINAGLEIIDTLGKHWGVDMPIVIDNAESVVRLIDTSAQKIKFYVDENAKQLMVEV